MKKYILSISILPLALILSMFFNVDTASTREPPTSILGEVPTDYESWAYFGWTGGTLYQLKTRLQTLGCHADRIVVYDLEKEIWSMYSQYSWPLKFNQEFHDRYPGDYIPPSVIHIPHCYDICKFEYTDELIEEIESKDNSININIWPRCSSPREATRRLDQYRGRICNQNWDPRTIEYVFPIMPVMKDLCIFRINTNRNSSIDGEYNGNLVTLGKYRSVNLYHFYKNIWISAVKPFVTVYNNRNEESFFVELHELCHSQQDWYVAQFMSPYELYTKDQRGLWNNTPAWRELIEMTNFEIVLDENIKYFQSPDWVFPEWKLDPNSPHRNVYPFRPHYPYELGAQLCAIKLYLDINGVEEFNFYHIRYSRDMIAGFTEWLDKYIFVLEE